MLLNPGAFTHTSIALRDALAGAKIPFIEVHLSNVHAREQFRKHSYLSDIAVGVITGLGPKGYELALAAAIERVK
jgi:3-dehydroquinate dehydratase-2